MSEQTSKWPSYSTRLFLDHSVHRATISSFRSHGLLTSPITVSLPFSVSWSVCPVSTVYSPSAHPLFVVCPASGVDVSCLVTLDLPINHLFSVDCILHLMFNTNNAGIDAGYLVGLWSSEHQYSINRLRIPWVSVVVSTCTLKLLKQKRNCCRCLARCSCSCF